MIFCLEHLGSKIKFDGTQDEQVCGMCGMTSSCDIIGLLAFNWSVLLLNSSAQLQLCLITVFIIN